MTLIYRSRTHRGFRAAYNVTKPIYITLLTLAGLVPWPKAQAAPLTCTSVRKGACMVADTFSLEFDGQGLPLAVVNFGLFSASAEPGAFATICEEAFGGRTPENITVSNGKILIPSRQGVFVSTATDLCNWVLAKGLPAETFVQQAVVDPLVSTRIWALVGAGDYRGLYISEDQGTTFSLQHQFKRGEVWWRLTVLASTPRKVLVSGTGLVGPFAVGVSIDDGKTFVNRDPVPFLGTAADEFRTSILVAVSSPPSPRLYFVRDTTDGRDELWVSDDDARSAKPVLAMPDGHLLGGFAFGATENIVYVGSRVSLVTGKAGDSVLFKSSDGGTTWDPPILSSESGPRFRCLKFRDGFLYACAGGVDAGDSAYILRSADGVAWDPVLAMPQVQAPAACMRERCGDTTAWLCSTYGVCPPPKLDAGVADAGAGESAPSGCSCHVGANQQRGDLGALAAFCIACGALHLRARSKRRKRRPPSAWPWLAMEKNANGKNGARNRSVLGPRTSSFVRLTRRHQGNVTYLAPAGWPWSCCIPCQRRKRDVLPCAKETTRCCDHCIQPSCAQKPRLWNGVRLAHPATQYRNHLPASQPARS